MVNGLRTVLAGLGAGLLFGQLAHELIGPMTGGVVSASATLATSFVLDALLRKNAPAVGTDTGDVGGRAPGISMVNGLCTALAGLGVGLSFGTLAYELIGPMTGFWVSASATLATSFVLDALLRENAPAVGTDTGDVGGRS